MLDKTIDLVITSIREGVSKKVNDFIDSLIPEEAEQEIEKLKAIQKEFEEKAMANVEALMDKLSPYLKIFDVLKKIEEAAAVANTIISIIRWGARLLACASPPAVGCLWALAQSVLEGFAAMVIQSCWFTKKAGPPVAALLAKVDPVVSLPNTAAKFIIENVNELMPGGWKDTFPLPPSSALGQLVPQYDGSCDEEPERFNPERQEMYALIEEIGEEKFLAFMKMMDKGGAGPWVLLTPDRLRKIKDDLKAAKIEDIKKMTEGQKPENPETVKLEEFLKEISKYTKKETETRDKFFEEKKKKEEAKKGGGEGDKESGSGDGGDGDSGGAGIAEYDGTVKKGKLTNGTPVGGVMYAGIVHVKNGTPLKQGDAITGKVTVHLRIYIIDNNAVSKKINAFNLLLSLEQVTADHVVFVIKDDTLVEYGNSKLSFSAGAHISIAHNAIIYKSL